MQMNLGKTNLELFEEIFNLLAPTSFIFYIYLSSQGRVKVPTGGKHFFCYVSPRAPFMFYY